MSAAAAIWGLAALVVGWCAFAIFLAASLAATGRRLAELQTAIEAHRESPGACADDVSLYRAAGLDPDIPPLRSPDPAFIRGERFR